MKTRIFRAFLITLLLSFVISACSVKSADDFHANDSYTNEVVTQAGTFSGTFRIKTESSASLTLDPLSSVSSTRADAMAARYAEIEELFSCVVEAKKVNDGSIAETMMAFTAAARNYADIFQLSAEKIYEMYRGNYLTYAQNLDEFDITSEKWGYDGQKAAMTFKEGETYGFRNIYWSTPIPSVSGVLFYNTELIAQNSLASPAEHYENNSWNWDTFRNICVTVTQNIEDEQGTYGFLLPSSDYPEFIHAAVYSNGGQRLYLKNDGSFACGYNDLKTINALEWVSELVREDDVCYTLRSTPSDVPDIEAFVNFRTVFLAADSAVGVTESENYPLYSFESGFRWIEFPKGPSFTGVTTARYTSADEYLALSNTVDIGIVGKILNAMFEPLSGEDETGWKDYLNRNFFFYEEDFDMFEIMLKNAETDYSVYTSATNLTIGDLFAAVIDGAKTPKEAVEQLSPVVEGLLG